MPEQYTQFIRKPDRGMLAVAGVVGAGGVALIVWAIARGQGIPLPPLAPLNPGESMGRPFSASLDSSGVIHLRRGDLLSVLNPTAEYEGPGRDTFSYCSVVQLQGRQWVTVYGSGVAGVHVGPSQSLAAWPLVSVDQLQPPGCAPQSLCMFPWPGPQPASCRQHPGAPEPSRVRIRDRPLRRHHCALTRATSSSSRRGWR